MTPPLPLAAALLLTQVCCVGVSSWRVARAVAPAQGRGLERVCVAGLTSMVQIVAVLQVLGIVHLIHPLAVVTAHVVIAALVLRYVTAAARTAHRASASTAPDPLWILVIAVGAFLALWSAAEMLNGTSQEWDTMRYHVVNASQWLQSGQLWSLPFAAPGDYTATDPGNGELVGLWMMLPLHSDGLAYSVSILAGIVCVSATGMLAASLGGRAPLGALFALVVLATPVVFLSQAHALNTDLWVGAGTVTAVAFALHARGQESPAWLLLAGAGLGFAAGTKYVGLLPAAASFCAAVAVSPGRRRLRAALLMSGPAIGVAGVWYVRNWVETGDPIFPQHVGLLGRTIFQGHPTPTYDDALATLGHHIASGRWDLVSDWPAPAVHTAGAALILILALFGIPTMRRRGSVACLGRIALLVVSLIAIYTVTPFSGGGDSASPLIITASIRYAITALFVSAGLAAALLVRMSSAWLVAAALLCVDAFTLHDYLYSRPDLVFSHGVAAIAIGGAALAAALWWWSTRSLRVAVRPTRAAVVGIAATYGACLVGCALVWPPNGPTAIDSALARAGTHQRVVIIDAIDVRTLLNPRLDAPIAPVGIGPLGQQDPYTDASGLDAAIQRMGPVVVAVSHLGIPDTRPPGWFPPPSWSYVGEQGEAQIYIAP